MLPQNSTLQEVLVRLPKLKNAELAQVRQRLDLLCKSSAATSNANDWLLEGLTAELRRRGIWLRNGTIPNNLIPAAYGKSAENVRQRLLAGTRGSLRSVEKVALARVGAEALAEYLIAAKVPVSLKTLLGAVGKLPLALDDAFPGYWEEGLLSKCVRVT